MFKKLSATILILVCIIVSAASPAAALDFVPIDYGFDEYVSANAAMLVNLDTDTIIYEKNADTRIHPASTTKIMSIALGLELCNDLEGTIVTIPNDVWVEFQGLDVSHAGLKAGEEITMKDLLYCMMLQSANEASVALADYYGRDEFLRKMNQKAAELGCQDTHFNNPHGAFVADHYTTARDMLIITQWALTVPGFFEMSQLSRYYKAPTNLNDGVTLVSTNYMQDPGSRYYTPYIKGIKTGTLGSTAGRCLVSAAEKDGVTYLCLVFGSPMEPDNRIWEDGNSSFTDTRVLCDWAFANLDLVNVVDGSTVAADIKIRFASDRDTLLLYPDGELYAIAPKDSEEPLTVHYEYDLPENIKAPVQAGDVIGTAEVYYGGQYVGQVNLVSRENVSRSAFMMFIDTLGDILTSTVAKIIYIVLLLFVLLYLYYMLVAVPRAQKKKKSKKK